MRKKLQNTIRTKLPSFSAIIGILVLWQIVSSIGLVPKYMLPSPAEVIVAFLNEFPLLMSHMRVTLVEAFFGLILGTLLGFLIAVWMERFPKVYQAIYPVIVITQTVPTVAIAPLLVLWLGYGIAPKIVLIIIVTFFPITVGLLDGFHSADKDAVQLLRSMGATKFQIFYQIKLPSSLSYFFASLKISVSYSIVGAVISEWLGGFKGLGVYMTRVKKSYAFDKMFAVIFLISAISLLLMKLVGYLKRRCMPWEEK
ncbi:ABC transporter permease [Lachnoclostridium phytofermentans]|uniref:ABC transporter permease n=1 Tax=Lachnoclostridium phytofermentans TaxID=66219 RepID=UPI0004972043|nr:ABC transporter permease [Lachnoclostridium phytofermentans]